jgi:hypothetical protein
MENPAKPKARCSQAVPHTDRQFGPWGCPQMPTAGTPGVPHSCLVGAQQQEHARRPPALATMHTEQLSAAGAVGAADRTQSAPERRDRTTAVATVATAQNGTSGALADSKHAGRRATWATPRTGNQSGGKCCVRRLLLVATDRRCSIRGIHQGRRGPGLQSLRRTLETGGIVLEPVKPHSGVPSPLEPDRRPCQRR